jgi:acetyltransferase-like isoleucine patch superfamily enzyme
MQGSPSAYEVLRRRSSNAMAIGRSYIRAKLTGADSFGTRPVIRGKARFRFDGTTHIGHRFMVEGFSLGVSIKVARGAILSIGDDVYMNDGSSIEVWREIRIGNNVLLAPLSSIIDDDRHEVEPHVSRSKQPTIIGNNVWLGRCVSVLPGAVIGDNSVIGANSVVTRDIPPNCFAAGAPARVIRKLEIPDGWLRS